MRKSLVFVIFAISFITTQVMAQAPNLGEGVVATVEDSSCAMSQANLGEYENPVRFTSNSKLYVDQCLDTERFRPAVVLEDTSRKIVFANFLHNDQYWIAELSKSETVEQLYYQVVRFSVIEGVTAAHVQIRARFGNGLKLRKSVNGNIEQTVNDFVISYEATRPKGEPYNFAMGAFGNYGLVGRVLSGQQRLDEESPESETEQYAIELPQPQSDSMELVLKAINGSARSAQRRVYNSLRPNCATEAFDLIDSVSSVAQKNPRPFLTVFSNDPIAQPSLVALRVRGILKGESPTMRDEIENGNFSEPKAVDLSVNTDSPYIASIPGRPYTLLTLETETSIDPQLEAEMKKLVENMVPRVFEIVGLASLEGENTFDVVMDGLNQLAEELKSELSSVEASKLPTNPHYVRVFFTPWLEGRGTVTRPLAESGIPALLPLPTVSIPDRGDSIYFITQGLTKVMDELHQKAKHPYFMSAGVNLKLARNDVSAKVQAVIGLPEMVVENDEPLTSNEQITLNKLTVPRNSGSLRPVAITTLSLTPESDPVVEVELGPEGGLKPGDLTWQINKSLSGCELQASATPTLTGTLGPEALGTSRLARLLEGKPVALSIFKMTFDPKIKRVSDMDIRIASWPVECRSDGNVNAQFADEVNVRIQDIENSVSELSQSDDSWSNIMDHLFKRTDASQAATFNRR